MPNDFIIRQGEPKDITTIANFNILMAMETENLRLDPYKVEAGVRNALEDNTKGLYYVAEIADQIIGQLMLTREWSDWRNGDIWWIQSVYVTPNYRKHGIFKALYQHVQSQAKIHHVVMIRLYVENHNELAKKVYKSLGMKDSGYTVLEIPV